MSKPIPKEYLGAFKRGHRHNSKEYIDEELSHWLLAKAEAGCAEAKEALVWLTQFNNEFHKAAFIKTEKPLHATKALKKDCNARNYSRRNDIYTKRHRSIGLNYESRSPLSVFLKESPLSFDRTDDSNESSTDE